MVIKIFSMYCHNCFCIILSKIFKTQGNVLTGLYFFPSIESSFFKIGVISGSFNSFGKHFKFYIIYFCMSLRCIGRNFWGQGRFLQLRAQIFGSPENQSYVNIPNRAYNFKIKRIPSSFKHFYAEKWNVMFIILYHIIALHFQNSNNSESNSNNNESLLLLFWWPLESEGPACY